MKQHGCYVMQNISQWRSKKACNCNVTLVRNSNTPKPNVNLMSSKHAIVTKQGISQLWLYNFIALLFQYVFRMYQKRKGISNESKNTFFKESEVTSCDINQNISKLHTKKKLSYNVICIRNSDVPKADFILMPLI